MVRFVAVLALLFACSVGANAGSEKGYYGHAFLDGLERGTLKGDALRGSLHDILDETHNPGSDGFDEISTRCSASGCYEHTEIGYDAARKAIFGDFYLVPQGKGYGLADLYCDRTMAPEEFGNQPPGPGRVPDHTIVNVEHTWPQSQFSRRYLKEKQKSDLHHLFPTDSEMNSRRSSYDFGVVVQDQRKPLKCSNSSLGESAGGNTVFQPPASHRGNVARAMFYFAVRYEMNIDPEEEATLREWSHQDPIDDFERNRNQRIFEMQKNRNPFIDFPGLEDSIANF
jgi:deoxyribonuclease-1